MKNSEDDMQEREARQHALNLTKAVQDTADLRQSDAPRWEGLRRRLTREGVAVEDAAIADRFIDDVATEFGLVITQGDRAFSFEFDFSRDEDGRDIEYADARLSEWRELDRHRREVYKRELKVGREVLDSETPDR